MKHLLVTNDFPPKIGGIQSLLWEWWRRLPPDRFAVLTSPYDGAAQFDSAQAYRIERTREPVLLPHPWMVRRIDDLAREVGADLVVLDPAVPLGLVGPSLQLPYDVVLHGAEVTVPGRLPGTKQALGNVLRRARHVVSAGEYAAREAERAAGARCRSPSSRPASTSSGSARSTRRARARPGAASALPVDAELIVSISRLVPRKGFDVAIEAAALLAPRRPDLVLAISGGGRDERRLRRLAAERRAPVVFLGRVANDDLPDALRLRRRLRHGLPLAVGRARAGGLRHRVRRGRGVRRAAGRRRLGRRRRGGRRRRHRARRAPARRRRRRSPRRSRRCSTTTPLRASMAAASRARAVAEFSYDVLAAAPRHGAGGVVTSPSRRRATPPATCCVTADVAGTARVRRHGGAGGGDLHDVLAVGRRDHRARAVRRRRVRLPVVVLQRRAAQPQRRDRRRPAVPPARPADAAARCGGSMLGAAARRRSRSPLVTTFARLEGPDGKPGSSLALGFLVPMFGFGLNGLWAAYHGDFPASPR